MAEEEGDAVFTLLASFRILAISADGYSWVLTRILLAVLLIVHTLFCLATACYKLNFLILRVDLMFERFFEVPVELGVLSLSRGYD